MTTRESTDLVNVWRDQWSRSVQLFGHDVTAISSVNKNVMQPATSQDYAFLVIEYWVTAVEQAIRNTTGLSAYLAYHYLDATELDESELPALMRTSQGRIELDWLEKSGAALEQMFKAANSAIVGSGGKKRIIGSGNAQFWDSALLLAKQLNSLSFRVTAEEKWQAFRDGLKEGVENVGEAVAFAVEKTGEGLGATIAALFKGLGLVGVAFAIGAIIVFKSKLV